MSFYKCCFEIALAALALLCACGPISISDDQALNVDAVKLISADIVGDQDISTYLQNAYTLSSERRLLLRREDLIRRRADLIVDVTHPVQLKIDIRRAVDRAAALLVLRLCPITKNWMMLATWNKAHPFGNRGKWSKLGGDFEDSECVLGTADTTDSTVIFDVTAMVESRLVGRAEAFGWILYTTGDDVELTGDNNYIFGPRLSFTESH